MIFYDEEHKYIHEEEVYTSVTTLTGKFEKKKDWLKIATEYSKKNGETPEHWLKVWDDNKVAAGVFGTLYHGTREEELQNIIVGNKESIDLVGLQGDYAELIVFDTYYKVAGQVDRVTVKDKKLFIRDFKTCKSIDKRGFKGERMLSPVSKLEACNYSKFCLQLSLYGIILEFYGYEVEDLVVEHIVFPERELGYEHLTETLLNGTLKEKRVEYQIPYLKKEALSVLEHHRLTKRNSIYG